jgi:alkyl sulfatase BDS1-like metallo-beta-lactamase superfamily hydrolase
MGGADAVIRHAREDFKNGEYRFVAEVANKLVFADPSNQQARDHLTRILGCGSKQHRAAGPGCSGLATTW